MEISQVCIQARCSGPVPCWLLLPVLQHSAFNCPCKMAAPVWRGTGCCDFCLDSIACYQKKSRVEIKLELGLHQNMGCNCVNVDPCQYIPLLDLATTERSDFWNFSKQISDHWTRCILRECTSGLGLLCAWYWTQYLL